MLVVCSDIHVLGSPLMSAEATRMQDLASDFSNIFRGWHPRTRETPGPHSGRGQTPPAPTTARARGTSVSGRKGFGAQAPRCWVPNLGPPQLFSRGCAPEAMENVQVANDGPNCRDETYKTWLYTRLNLLLATTKTNAWSTPTRIRACNKRLLLMHQWIRRHTPFPKLLYNTLQDVPHVKLRHQPVLLKYSKYFIAQKTYILEK